MGEEMGSLFDKDLKVIPKLDICYLCKSWHREEALRPILILDQGNNYIQKLACQECLDPILLEKKPTSP